MRISNLLLLNLDLLVPGLAPNLLRIKVLILFVVKVGCLYIAITSLRFVLNFLLLLLGLRLVVRQTHLIVVAGKCETADFVEAFGPVEI